MRLLSGFFLLASALSAQDASAILTAKCGQCHGAAAMSGLSLATREAALKGGTKGPAIVPGNASASLLIQAVEQRSALKMPPGQKLEASEIAALRKWIEGGAPWTPVRQAPAAPQWWSFRKPERPPVPGSSGNEIDRFLAVRMREKSIQPAPEADRVTLIRRAYYDLHGLPPSYEQIQAFANDNSPGAWARLIDELLASPRYGEKWGRFWLDLVRYADTAGFEMDPYTPDAWRYRDYVIESFNKDKPYDRFVKEQIAGDEIWPEDVEARIGTGYYCVGPNRDINPEQAEVNREETLTDWVDTTGSVFLGLTVGCARCHDHKFDPIAKRDYYRMQAIFTPMVKTRIPLSFLPALNWDGMQNRNEVKLQEYADRIESIQARCRDSLYEAKLAKLDPETRAAVETPAAKRTPRQGQLFEAARRNIGVGQRDIRACMTPEETTRLHEIEEALVGLAMGYKPKPYACGVTDVSRESPRTYMPARGSQVGDVTGEVVTAGFPGVLGGAATPDPPLDAVTTHRRKALAEWLASPEHPLTARVMVNRVWQQHFGRGLARLASDLGSRGGESPHQELLDWLTTEFLAKGWSVKALHRQIMTSPAYRRASTVTDAGADPENQYFARFERRRLTAEEIRDSVLQAAGALNLKMGGRPVVTPLSKEELYNLTRNASDAWFVNADESEHTRRSIYMISKRTFRMPMMDVFDTPESMLSCPRRDSSTTAPQSLTLLNGSFAIEQARRLGGQAHGLQGPHGSLGLIQNAWRRVLGRDPEPEDVRLAQELLDRQKSHLGSPEAAAAELARGLFNLNEFLYVD